MRNTNIYHRNSQLCSNLWRKLWEILWFKKQKCKIKIKKNKKVRIYMLLKRKNSFQVQEKYNKFHRQITPTFIWGKHSSRTKKYIKNPTLCRITNSWIQEILEVIRFLVRKNQKHKLSRRKYRELIWWRLGKRSIIQPIHQQGQDIGVIVKMCSLKAMKTIKYTTRGIKI